jgi:hypothetical protein
MNSAYFPRVVERVFGLAAVASATKRSEGLMRRPDMLRIWSSRVRGVRSKNITREEVLIYGLGFLALLVIVLGGICEAFLPTRVYFSYLLLDGLDVLKQGGR